jgi:hypothetical protein
MIARRAGSRSPISVVIHHHTSPVVVVVIVVAMIYAMHLRNEGRWSSPVTVYERYNGHGRLVLLMHHHWIANGHHARQRLLLLHVHVLLLHGKWSTALVVVVVEARGSVKRCRCHHTIAWVWLLLWMHHSVLAVVVVVHVRVRLVVDLLLWMVVELVRRRLLLSERNLIVEWVGTVCKRWLMLLPI